MTLDLLTKTSLFLENLLFCYTKRLFFFLLFPTFITKNPVHYDLLCYSVDIFANIHTYIHIYVHTHTHTYKIVQDQTTGKKAKI